MAVRSGLALLLVTLSGFAAAAQQQGSLEARIESGLQSGLGSGLPGEFRSGLSGTLGDPRGGRLRPDQPTDGVYLNGGSCAPGQADLNRSGCRPIEWYSSDSLSTYDRSIEAMAPLRGLTLDAGPGPDTE